MLIVGLIKKDSVLIHNGIKTSGAILLTTIVTTGLKYGINQKPARITNILYCFMQKPKQINTHFHPDIHLLHFQRPHH